MKYKGRRDEDVPEAAVEAARVLPPTPGLEGFTIDRVAKAFDVPRELLPKEPIRSTDVLPGKPVHKRGHRV